MRNVFFLFFLIIIIFSCNQSEDFHKRNICKKYDSSYIHYVSKKRQLFICHENSYIDYFYVSHASNGMGKEKRGDRKTPLGFYSLSRPRLSSSVWRTFVHIGYPTHDQKNKNYSGGSVGIHGPFKYFPFANNLVNYGAGCIVTSNNKDIDLIANHITNLSIDYIYIE